MGQRCRAYLARSPTARVNASSNDMSDEWLARTALEHAPTNTRDAWIAALRCYELRHANGAAAKRMVLMAVIPTLRQGLRRYGGLM